MERTINDFPKLSCANRAEIFKAGHANCYFCMRACRVAEISDWADEGATALCPTCGIDALIAGEVSKEDLVQASEKFFCKRN